MTKEKEEEASLANGLRIAYTTSLTDSQDEDTLVKHAALIRQTREVLGPGVGVSQSVAAATGPNGECIAAPS